MDNQLTKPKVLVQRLIIVVMAVLLAIFASVLGVYLFQISDPYVQEVLSLHGDPVRGYAIFQINCAGCHGSKADGHVGPSLHGISKRKSEVALIHQVTSGNTPPMPKFQPESQDMTDLLSYLQQL